MLFSHLLPVAELTVRSASYADYEYFFYCHRTNLFVDSNCLLKYSDCNLVVDDDCSEIFRGNC